MPIFETFHCPKKMKNIAFCTDGYKIVKKGKSKKIVQSTCPHWKKGNGCTFKEA